jgi:iron(III) transport system substrate-binding protein
MRRAAFVLLLAALVAAPFLLRPRAGPAGPADDTVVVVTPHNEAIRHEYGLGFAAWYRARTGRTVAVDWRVLGGTSDIARLLQGQYAASFRNYWEGRLRRTWSEAVEAGFQNPRLAPGAPEEAGAARAAFLASEVSCGMDVFFGGGIPDFEHQAELGDLAPGGMERLHPDWFGEERLPASYDGTRFRDPQGRWYGSVMSCYGIIYNADAVRRLGFAAPPGRWADLADPRFRGEIALCDPTKSGSMAMAFESVIQQEMHARADRVGPEGQAAAVRAGWLAGLRLIQRIGANARYFTDSSQKPPVDVADGNCAAGMCIDFYGAQQQEAERRRGAPDRVGFVVPPGGTAYFVDPIARLRGAPHPGPAQAFLEYALSLEGQKLWAFRPGTPGGPQEFALRRLPVRKDFYAHAEWKPLRSDPDADPYAPGTQLVYRPEWTGPLFRPMGFIIRVMCEDTHEELARAWAACLAAPEPARSRALAILQDLSTVSYDQASGAIARELASADPTAEVRLARDLAASFRANYAEAEAIAGK